MATATLVLTTIFDPTILVDYYHNFLRFGHLDEVQVVVIPDRKTPPVAFETCKQLAGKGLDVRCPSLDEQEDFLRRLSIDPGFIPYNSDNRRNIGFLMALEDQSDILVSIDDDNFCQTDEDYLGSHAAALSLRRQHRIASSETKFLNICELLRFGGPLTPYPRGYPYYARHKAAVPTFVDADAHVMINAGLWLRDPDVDAISWLSLRPCVSSFKGQSLVLGDHTWAPVNSQNTALAAALIPSYYFVRMGYHLNGTAIDRYGDIFSGYFALACAKHLGGAARFGTPIADHRRNKHDYLRDATAEWQAILLLEDVLSWLVSHRLEGTDCCEAYLSLADGLADAVETFHGAAWSDSSRGFFHQMAHCMRSWVKACRTISG